MKNKRTVIFDLGGVLIDWNPKYLYKKIFDNESKMDAFLENICDMAWNEKQDAGRSLLEGTAEKIQQHPEFAEYIKAYYSRWTEMLGGPKQDVVKILETLKGDDSVDLLALTNWSAETFPIAQEKYDFLNWFRGIVVSGTEKTRKPFDDIYHILLDRYNVAAQDAIFIDDNLRNVEAARTIGIDGIHFQSANQLETELNNRGIQV